MADKKIRKYFWKHPLIDNQQNRYQTVFGIDTSKIDTKQAKLIFTQRYQ